MYAQGLGCRRWIVLYCIALHCIALHCIALYCIVLYCIVWIVNYKCKSGTALRSLHKPEELDGKLNGNKIRALMPCSHLVPKHSARARLSLDTNVNTPFFQGPTPEFGYGVRARVQGRLALYSGTKVRVYIVSYLYRAYTQCLNTAPFCADAQALVLGYQV